ncbi:ATP-binding protein [Spirillospora sp. NBC_01491]|uniref:ATP-binding protein n=1 Tax=Spirillospora sp. NBC_01491 TaxID=2976007 RepID=UPI002E34C44E|nr:hypothetical protein [Spirillospora sp. NBC_01491]
MNTSPELIDETAHPVPPGPAAPSGAPPAAGGAPPSRPAAGPVLAVAGAAAGPAPPATAGPDRVWALPAGPGCAGHARRVLADALAELGVARDTIGDAALMVSELATNAHQHAGGHVPHELWLYQDEPDDRPPGEPGRPAEAGGAGEAGEIRCAVFDAFADARLPGYSWTSGDCGRGIGIVHELSAGRWGMLRTLSRLGPEVRGKAVWFAIPVPARALVPAPVPAAAARDAS